MPNSDKQIFISHSSRDNDFARTLADKLREVYGPAQVWIDLHDLDIGDELATKIPRSLSGAKWFVLLASNVSMQSNWVRFEARLALKNMIERSDFTVLTLKIEDCDFPPELDLLKGYQYVRVDSPEQAFTVLQPVLEQDAQLKKTLFAEPFIDRGQDRDQLELLAERHKVIFITGPMGIGKSALIYKVAEEKFKREVIEINLTLGHDLQRLCREILARCGKPQPADNEEDDILLQDAIWALNQQIQDNKLLFMRNFQNALGEEGVRPYLFEFLQKYGQESSIRFPVLLSGTRKPYFQTPLDYRWEDIRLDRLDDEYTILAIQKWYQYIHPDEKEWDEEELRPLAENLNGHPLAARMIVRDLQYEGPRGLLRETSLSKFKRTQAEYILGKLNVSLTKLQRHILYAMAILDAPITIRHLLAIKTIKEAGHETIEKAVVNLCHLLLVTEMVDTYALHPFIASYFIQEAQKDIAADHKTSLYDTFARELAEVTFNHAQETKSLLDKLMPTEKHLDNQRYSDLGRQLLGATIPAQRLLLLTNQHERAKKLPYHFKGHLRQIALEAYRRFRKYEMCVEFGQQWLKIDPKDDDVRLEVARAHRQLKNYPQAETLLKELEFGSRRMQAQVLRERGLIAYDQSEFAQAIEFYEMAKKKDTGYETVNESYARALVARANRLRDDDPRALADYEQAADLLKISGPSPRISTFHEKAVDFYVEVALKAQRITIENAIGLLKEEIEVNPADERLHYRLADVMQHQASNWDEAVEHAEQAMKLGYESASAPLIIAKIRNEQKRYQDAINALDRFRPRNQTDQQRTHRDIIAIATEKARAYTSLKRFDDARKELERLQDKDSYVFARMADNEYEAAKNAFEGGNPSTAQRFIREAKNVLQQAESRFPSKKGFFNGARTKIEKLETQLRDRS